MDYPLKIFHRGGPTKGLSTVDAKLVEQEDEKVYHTKDDNTVALRVGEENSTILREDGEVEDIWIDFVWEKICSYEVYTWGGRVHTSDIHIHFRGECHTKGTLPKFKRSSKIKINDCVLMADGNGSGEWSWDVIKNGSSSIIGRCPKISEAINKDCILVGYEYEIDTVQLCQDMM